jgi:hypothetical protein
MRADGTIGEIRRSVVLGSVAELPTRREAQVRLDEKLRSVIRESADQNHS